MIGPDYVYAGLLLGMPQKLAWLIVKEGYKDELGCIHIQWNPLPKKGCVIGPELPPDISLSRTDSLGSDILE